MADTPPNSSKEVIGQSSAIRSQDRRHVSVCVCTYRRSELLQRLLESLTHQRTAEAFTFSVVVADNDVAESARLVVTEFAARALFSVRYCVEPRQNIALVRNKAIEHARGEFIAFIDDDEFPAADWLLNLFLTCESHGVAGVLGPVMPHFDCEPPRWLVRGGFYDRPTHPTGFVLPWQECRTGNVLLCRRILAPAEPPFRREFGTGGEDQDFFQRMMANGHRFIWCDEAVAYEVVPRARWSRRFLLSRALLRGKNSLRHRDNRVRNVLKSVIAAPVYALALPLLFMAGQHYFMRYSVKLADHLGRMLALVGLNPVSERRM